MSLSDKIVRGLTIQIDTGIPNSLIKPMKLGLTFSGERLFIISD